MSDRAGALARGPAAPGKARGRRRRLPSLTADGKAALILLGIALFAGFNTGTNLVYLLASTLAAFLVLSMWESRRAVGVLEIHADLPKEAVEGEVAVAGLVVRNTGTRPARFLRARIDFESSLGARAEPVGDPPSLDVVPPGEERRLLVRLRFPMRGIYVVRSAVVESTYPMGLLTMPRPVDLPPLSLTVLPKLLPVAFRGVSSHQQETLTDETRTYVRGDGSVFYGLREYQPGDPLKMVHWKSTARVGALMVQELQKNLSARYYIYLDVASEKLSGKGPASNLETSVRLCATLCNQLSRDNCLSQILIYQDEMMLSPPIFTASDAYLMLRFLGGIVYTRGTSLARLIEKSEAAIIPDSFLIFVLVDLDEAIVHEILRVAGPDQRCILILNVDDHAQAKRIEASGAIHDLVRAGVRPIFYCRCDDPASIDLERRQTAAGPDANEDDEGPVPTRSRPRVDTEVDHGA